MKHVFKVIGLDCASEEDILKKVLRSKKGITGLSFDVMRAKMIVTCEDVSPEQITKWVKEGGMEAVLWQEKEKIERQNFWDRYGRLCTTVISGGFLILAIFFHFRKSPAANYLYFMTMVFGAYFVIPKALQAIKKFQPDMNLLMVIAMGGAIAINEWFEGATVAFLFSVALLLEHWSIERARKAVSALMDLSPPTAHVIDEGEKEVEEVKVGDRILIRPGERVPLDGTLEKGATSIDQSPITGESIPVSKEKGDEIFAGTINGEGAIECLVTKKSSDTTLAQIIHLVEEAQTKRASAQQFVQKFAKVYTPIMLCIAVLVILIPPLLFGLGWDVWIYRALVILVIACPCALVISTPVSIVSGMTAAARKGVLIKGGMFIELPSKLRALALDKTGTLTYGHPEIQSIIPLAGHTEEELLIRAASLEEPSEHPIARAILSYAEKMKVPFKRAEDFQITQGKGAEGTIDGVRYWIGSHRFMHEMKQETPEIHEKALELEDAGHSVVAIGNERHVCGLISVADEPRTQARKVIQELKEAGIEQVVMLTGDNKPAAQAIAKLTGVDQALAELLPADKVNAIDRLKEKWGAVAMVGDGINDAPAMAAASFGIAMGGMGSDAAIETSDIVLMSDDISRIPWLIRHSRRTVRMVQQNITFALCIKAIFLTLAVAGLASLWMAIVADTGAALVVVSNGLRLLKHRS